MSLTTIIYVSSATRRMSDSELESLLVASRARNAKHNITGMLLHRDGSFMQVIEGEDSELHALYDLIIKDRRHQGVITLLDEPIEAREFGDWQMGFENIDQITYALLSNAGTGAGKAVTDLLESQSAGRSRRLLAGFLDRALR